MRAATDPRALGRELSGRPGAKGTTASDRLPSRELGRPAFARRLAAVVLENGLPDRTLLNVGVSPGTPGRGGDVQGRRTHESTILEGVDPRHRTCYWIEEGRDDRLSDEMSDVFALRSGLSVTPLQTDATDHVALARSPAGSTTRGRRVGRPEGPPPAAGPDTGSVV